MTLEPARTMAVGGSTGSLPSAAPEPVERDVVTLYDRYFDFVWRSLRRLGVAPDDLEDATQDVFVVVHQRIEEFVERATVKTWIFAIALRIAKAYRRKGQRQRARIADETVLVSASGNPEEARAMMQIAERVQLLLEQLDDDKRAVFVLAELEHMQAHEISAALGIPTNTVYSRLRLARAAFENGLKRLAAKDDWRHR